MASATTLPDFYFKFEGVKRDDGSEYVMTDDDVDLIVTSMSGQFHRCRVVKL